jgi:hypothetical protein
MILLHGGMSMQMLYIILGGIVIFLGFVVLLHVIARRTRFYKAEFVNFNGVQKILYYIFFLIVSCSISWGALYVLMITATLIMSFFK